MNRLIIVVLVVALAWMSFWAVASVLLERNLTAFLDGPQNGVEVRATSADVSGFPNRLDTTLTDVTFTFPGTDLTWDAPFVQILALVYRPTEIIAVLPERHSLASNYETVEITQESARASVALTASTDLALDRATLVIENGRAQSSRDWDLSIDQTRLSIAMLEPLSYRLGLEAQDIASGALPSNIPGRVDRVGFDIVANVTRPLDRRAVEDEPPQITALQVRNLSAAWGEMQIGAVGDLDVDDRGRPEGVLTLRIEKWERLFDLAVDTGVLDTDFTPALKAALGTFTDRSAAPGTIEVPMTFERGFMSIGPIPLGPAPDLTIR